MILLILLKITLTYGIAPIIGAALIGAAAGGAQSIATGKMNKKSRRFQEKMWNQTNKYNSPREQMKRLQDAGLNPNLVYGQSSGGAAGTADQPSMPNFNTPEFEKVAQPLAQGAMQYFNAKQIESGIEVNNARTEEIKQDTINKGIDAVQKAINASSGSIDLRAKNRLYENTIKTAEERLRNLSINTEYTAGRNSRENRIIDETEQKMQQEISNLKTQGNILSEDAIMKRIDRILYQDYKVRPQDPIYYRIMGDVLRGLGIGLESIPKSFNNLFKKK